MADAQTGLYSIEVLPHDEFAPPRRMPLFDSASVSGDVPTGEDSESGQLVPTAMVVFTLGAISGLMTATALIVSIVGLLVAM